MNHFVLVVLIALLSLYGCNCIVEMPMNVSSPKAYGLQVRYSGNNFFDGWNFWTANDPTDGYVNYVSQQDAQQKGYIKAGSPTYIGADHTNHASGRGRDSIRITTQRSWNGGLFIMDLEHMPTGCGTWPAWWLVGPNWPNSGEIDIIEGINTNSVVQTTLHTSNGCTMSGETTSHFSGTWGKGSNNQPAVNCYINAPGQYSNQGCGIVGLGGSYGAPFNAGTGGVYAVEWTNSFIQMWFFPRNRIPPDINNSQPNPGGWGKPYAYFQLGGACPSNHFQNNNMVIDDTFCGQWAGASFGSQCPGKGSCESYVQNNPSAFSEAYWSIRYIAVYQQ